MRIPRLTPRSALLGLHIGALMFGLTGIFGKLILAGPLVIVFGRALFGALALGGAFPGHLAGQPRPSLRQLALLVGSGLLLCAHWLTFFLAVKVGNVAVATLGFASFPAFTVLLEGLLFGERIRASEYRVVGLVCIGLVMVTPSLDLAQGATAGLLWGVLSGLLFALLSLANRVSVRGLDPILAALAQNLTIILCLLPLALAELPRVRALDWLWLVLLGVFCTGVAHSLFVASLRLIKARTAAVIFALEPVYGIAFAALLFGEQPSLRMLAGGALILFATFLSARAAQ
ncbi:DMT family transporter [Pseudomonas panipatensis]|jgi:drug/metabolite transporter (DMT)-like permease|uniref:EamA domain-containing membrane protein RarD n=1 Tax=Pseudomonas panipatensis TaxID=428992 RepID=A0A1G8GI49_9PSED|nr:DMT family transporter [Pseudomonas panipatensis]SDH93986.1 EamA domain-containing membrane protein RarD [Pseudomonas panipatensis]SMP43153.1 EamA domain-containing membrane protein RarD [Pseudomonas panipatensis]